MTFWPSYSWTSDLHWFRVTFTCESKMTKAGIDLVKQSQSDRFIFCVSLTGPYVDFTFTGIALEIRMHECALRAYINGPRKRAHLISSRVYLSLMCWWIGAVRACFWLQYHHAVDISKACLFQILLSPWIKPVQLKAGTGLIVKCKSITSHFCFVLG